MKQRVIVLLLVLGAVIYAAWFYSSHEKYTTEQFVGYEGEARFNGFLAAELFLNAVGVNAESRETLVPSQWLPDFGDTIVMRVSGSITAVPERLALRNWIAQGGHLVLLPPYTETDLSDALLADFNLRLVPVDFDSDDDEEVEEVPDETETSADYLVDLPLISYRVEQIEDVAGSVTLSDDIGNIVVRHEYGDGYVTVVSGASLFTNRALDRDDHARLFLDIVDGYISTETVWLVYNADFRSLWARIWQAAPLLVIALLAVFLLWLWSAIPRFGPRTVEAPPARRSIVEHVKAAGNFVWRYDGGSQLFEATRAAVLHEAEARHPGISRLPLRDQVSLIANLSNRSEQAVMDALAPFSGRNHRAFTQTIELLQDIRSEL